MESHRPKDLRHIHMEAMLEGRKTVEGRINDSFWRNVSIGDTVCFYDNTGGREDDPPYYRPHHIREKYPFHYFVVTDMVYFSNFGDMYDTYGKSLLPDVQSRQEAIETYENISVKYTKENMERYGCVAVSLRKL